MIKWEALEDREVRKQLASRISFKFRQLHDTSEDMAEGIAAGQISNISSAAEFPVHWDMKSGNFGSIEIQERV